MKTSYEYDVDGQLVAVIREDRRVEYRYDAAGNRIETRETNRGSFPVES